MASQYRTQAGSLDYRTLGLRRVIGRVFGYR